MPKTAEILKVNHKLVPENGGNGDSYRGTLVGFTAEVQGLNPKLTNFRDFLADPPYPRAYLHPDQFQLDRRLCLYQYDDGFNGEYVQMMFIAAENPLETKQALARALEALYTLRFIAAGAASKTRGENSLETIGKQYQRLVNNKCLSKSFRPWKKQVSLLGPYYEQLRLLEERIGQPNEPVSEQEKIEAELIVA